MFSEYLLIVVLTLCLVFVTTIHIGYVKRVHVRFTNINLAYLLSMYVTAMRSVAVADPPIRSIPAGAVGEERILIGAVENAIVDYLRIWQWAATSMFAASRLPMMQFLLSVSHLATHVDEQDRAVAYAFQVSVQVNDNIQSFPLVVSNRDISKIVGKLQYHAGQLEQLVNHFMNRDEKGVQA